MKIHIHNHKDPHGTITFSTLFGARLIAFEGRFTPGPSRSPFGRTPTLGEVRGYVPENRKRPRPNLPHVAKGTRKIYPIVRVPF